MGVTYQRLPSSGSQQQRPRGGVRARAWVLLRWAAVRLSCAARRRYSCAARARRLAWPGLLCGRGATAAAPDRRGRRPGASVAAAAAAGAGAVVVGYDSASYARNFDDGAWKAEEGVSWAGLGAAASVPRASSGNDAISTGGDSLPSSN
ncbi:hypothetical protein BS78_07G186200 [Paspalum vaginatum]|uniref:Uncharacterized protein n=1 Tax=Paspalum vaginatum TaxID=158149 RepID=A0A9W8CD99_9POAL|nr:hypothetical protein BS78_K151500 [Paspalum vaginatum]KAJ1269121.1 hypothetical protein BS78_07G186200 [Paspalum vaginatum]